MGHTMTKLFLGAACALALGLTTTSALAQTGCPAGTSMTTIRTSTLKSPAMKADFDKAVQDHVKWYREHGYKADIFSVGQSIESKDGKTFGPSATAIITVHANSTYVPDKDHDAAWKAYVAEYRASSDITHETYSCMAMK